MTLDEKITELEKHIDSLNKPPVAIDDTEISISTETCEKHGKFECRTRIYTGTSIKIPPRPSRCPDCLRDELIKLQAEKIRQDDAARHRNISLLLDRLDIPSRFESCTLQNYEPVNDDAKRVLKVCQAYASRWPERLQKGAGWSCAASQAQARTTLRWQLPGMQSPNTKVQQCLLRR